MQDKNFEKHVEVFFQLLRAGLWEQETCLSQYEEIDYGKIYSLADEQSVVGFVAAGLEHVNDIKVPQEFALQFVGDALQLELRNQAMNSFIGSLIDKMRAAGIYTILVKGQGVAQCYERPLWRACGDIDFYLSESNYEVAKAFLKPMADTVDKENKRFQHLGMTIESWIVELHGSLHSSLSRKINKGLDYVHKAIFYGGEVRSWNDNGVTVFLPSANNDVIIIFAHIIQHFYIGGIGLRQVCDWCRLLWTYRDSLNHELLDKRIRKMGLMSEWLAFAALAVEFLGMPVENMPLYDENKCYQRKAKQVMACIIGGGNLGHNSDESYRAKYSGFKLNVITFFRRLREFVTLTMIFPLNAPKFFISYVLGRI